MNDLEPWKIWTATAVLVCAILGSTAARVRSHETEPTASGATVVSSVDGPTSVNGSVQDATSSQWDEDPSTTPHRTLSGTGYITGGSSGINPLANMRYDASASSAMQTQEYDEPTLDVAEQILGNQESQADLIATNDDLGTGFGGIPVFLSVDNQTSTTDLTKNRWVFNTAISDSAIDTEDSYVTVDGSGAEFVDVSGQPFGWSVDTSVRNAIINAALNGSESNGAVAVLESLGINDADRIEQMVELDGLGVAPTDNLDSSGDLSKELSDEQEVFDEAQTQALRAEALAQLQSAVQLRDEAMYSSTLGRINVHISGAAYAVQPEE